VVVLSLLSNARFTTPSFGVTMKPLFDAGVVIQPFTALVASKYKYEPEVAAETPLATAEPAAGALFPLTPVSVHDPLAVETLIVPAAVTDFRNRTSVALLTFADVIPLGNTERSNWKRP
jgi:hypothetical protein